MKSNIMIGRYEDIGKDKPNIYTTVIHLDQSIAIQISL